MKFEKTNSEAFYQYKGKNVTVDKWDEDDGGGYTALFSNDVFWSNGNTELEALNNLLNTFNRKARAIRKEIRTLIKQEEN